MKKDSIGNPLPQGDFLQSNATIDELDRAMTVNSFNLAAAVALDKGNTVIYDAEAKSATVSGSDGMTTFIIHD